MQPDRLEQNAALIAVRLDEAVHASPAGPLREAMAWAVSGGKGLRGHLVLESAALYGVARNSALAPAAAIEAIHAYSLVHDDLPAMDDDDLRRGRPTVHKRWDEATAILAGDALQSLSFSLIAEASDLTDAVKIALIASLAQAAGAGGMVLGQALDLAAERSEAPYSLDEIAQMQSLKTGALIEWAGTAGAKLACADEAALARYARALGQAFQIGDDLLDTTGSEADAGKRLNKDAAAGKATFVSTLGEASAKARGEALVQTAIDALHSFGPEADGLRNLARFTLERTK